MDANEFAEKIKAQYPQYKDKDNLELTKAVVEKHPEYASKVTFDAPQQTEKPSLIRQTVEKAISTALPSANFDQPLEGPTSVGIKDTAVAALKAAGQTLRDPTRINSTVALPGKLFGQKQRTLCLIIL
jgi:hypothetical protein